MNSIVNPGLDLHVSQYCERKSGTAEGERQRINPKGGMQE
jgi:hypothetical protein